MRSSWISLILFFIIFARISKGQAPKYSDATRSSTNDRITDTRGTRLTLIREPVYQAPNRRSIFLKKIDELLTDLDEQKSVFLTHKRNFDDHIYSFERRLAVLTQGMQGMSNKIQVLSEKNMGLENQLKKINEQFVLIPKEKMPIPQTEDEPDNRTQRRSASMSSVDEYQYLSNREAEYFFSLPMQPIKNSQKQNITQRTITTSKYSQRYSSKQKKPDYITEAILKLFAQDKLKNDRLSKLELQLKSCAIDSTTEILKLKDRKKRASDLEKKSHREMIVEAIEDAREASDARKSLFSVARKIPFYGIDEDARTVNFSHTFVNKGQHFVNNTKFVCHQNGSYFFTFTVRSLRSHITYVSLMKNQEAQTSIAADPGERSIMQTQSTILQMSRGDEVWLRVGPNSDFALDSEESHKYITFSGFLIYEGP